jgi:hypothetical protein
MILLRNLYNNNLWLHLSFGLHRFTQSNRCHLNSETVSVLGHHKQSSCLFFVHFGRDLSAPFFVFACQGHTMMDGGPPSVDSVLSVGTLLILLRLRVTSYIGLCLPVPEIHARGYSANGIYLSRSTFLTNVQQSSEDYSWIFCIQTLHLLQFDCWPAFWKLFFYPVFYYTTIITATVFHAALFDLMDARFQHM